MSKSTYHIIQKRPDLCEIYWIDEKDPANPRPILFATVHGAAELGNCVLEAVRTENDRRTIGSHKPPAGIGGLAEAQRRHKCAVYACRSIRDALKWAVAGNCGHLAAYVRRCLKSAEGAIRHADRLVSDARRKLGQQ